MAQAYNEAETLRLLADGSEQAFTQIYRRYSADIYKRAMFYLKSSVAAKEVMQEVFLKLWIKHKDVQTIDKFEHYLFVMAQNLIFDKLKASAKEAISLREYAAILKTSTGKPSNSEDISDAKLNEIIQVAEKLPAQCKEVFHLAKVKGLSYKDVATQLNISPFTVKNQLSKAVAYIRHNLRTNTTAYWLFIYLLA